MKDLQRLYGLLELERLRFFVDAIDLQIVDLLNKRFEFCLKISKVKRRIGKLTLDLDRQNQVLSNVEICSKNGFEEVNKLVFSTIMLMSSLLQFDGE